MKRMHEETTQQLATTQAIAAVNAGCCLYVKSSKQCRHIQGG